MYENRVGRESITRRIKFEIPFVRFEKKKRKKEKDSLAFSERRGSRTFRDLCAEQRRECGPSTTLGRATRGCIYSRGEGVAGKLCPLVTHGVTTLTTVAFDPRDDWYDRYVTRESDKPLLY